LLILEAISLARVRLGKKVLPEHLHLIIGNSCYPIGFISGISAGTAFTSRMKNWNSLVNSYPKTQFILMRDVREPEITGAVGKEEIEKLSYAENGKFISMDMSDRVSFELGYSLVIDIRNCDLDADIAIALKALETQIPEYWLTNTLLPN